MLFNIAADYALNGDNYKNDFINNGWNTTRDVTNLFFIFIMLAISIATILRRETYGAKALLPRLILVALLINFSLPIARTIIDASNILAIKFYTASGTATSYKAIGSDGKVVTKDVIDVSSKLLKNLSPIKLYQPQTAGSTSYGAIWLSGMLGIAILLITSFVFLAAAVLFTIRVLYLWVLLILSPMAFMFMILPKTQQHASDWWNKLLNQAFFAPVFMFFFYLSIRASEKLFVVPDDLNIFDFLATLFKGETGSLTTLLSDSGGKFINFIFGYIIVAGLMIGSLIAAQKLGAVGASTAISWGNAAYKGALGFAGKHTVGRAASAIDQKWGEKVRAVSPTVGGWAVDQFKRVGGDYKKGADAKVGAVAAMKDAGRQAQAMSNLNEAERTAAWKKLNPQQKAGLQSVATKDKTYEKMITGLATKDETARQKAAGERAGIAVVKEAQKQSTAQGYQDPKMIQSLIDQMASINVSSSLGEVDVPAIQKLAEELAVLGKDLTTVEKTFKAHGSTNAATIIQNITPGNRALINAALGAQIPKGEYKDKGAKPDTTGTPQP